MSVNNELQTLNKTGKPDNNQQVRGEHVKMDQQNEIDWPDDEWTDKEMCRLFVSIYINTRTTIFNNNTLRPIADSILAEIGEIVGELSPEKIQEYLDQFKGGVDLRDRHIPKCFSHYLRVALASLLRDQKTDTTNAEDYQISQQTEKQKPFFPIVLVDSTTFREMFKVFWGRSTHRNNDEKIRSEDEIRTSEKTRLGRQPTPQEFRDALKKEGVYKKGVSVCRVFPEYTISISTNTIDPGADVQGVASYKLANKIASVILFEAAIQKTSKDIIISKSRFLEWFGEKPTNKKIYQQIYQGLNALRNLQYSFHNFEYTRDSKNPTKELKYSEVGNFIYKITTYPKYYSLSVNESFVGCISQFWDAGQKVDKRKLTRGYSRFPTAFFPLSKEYATPSLRLAFYLLCDTGNRNINGGDCKVIAQKGEYLCERSGINHSRTSRRWTDLLLALRENQLIISKIVPDLKTLQKMSPGTGLQQTIHIYILKTKDLDKQIQLQLE